MGGVHLRAVLLLVSSQARFSLLHAARAVRVEGMRQEQDEACLNEHEPRCVTLGATDEADDGAVAKAGMPRQIVVCSQRRESTCEMLFAPVLENQAAAKLGTADEAATGLAFARFARSDAMVPFIHEALRLVERAAGLWSYHFRVLPWFRQRGAGPSGRVKGRQEINALLKSMAGAHGVDALSQAARTAGFAVYCVGNDERIKDVPAVAGLDNLDMPISYEDATGRHIEVPGVTQRDVLVWDREDMEKSYTRTMLDWQGRPCVVTVMSPRAPAALRDAPNPVRRQSELSSVEIAELWGDAGEAIQMHGGFEDCRLNAGTYQNLAHLHLKTFFKEADFQNVWGRDVVYQKLLEARKERNAVKGAH